MESNHNRIKMYQFYQKAQKTQKSTNLIVINSRVRKKISKEQKKMIFP